MDATVLKARLAELIQGVWTNGIDPRVVGARVTEFLDHDGWTLCGSGVFMFSRGNGGWVAVERDGKMLELSFGIQIPTQK